MLGWLNSVGSGPLTWMRSNATSTGWIGQHQRKGRQGKDDAVFVYPGNVRRAAKAQTAKETDR